ncbi:MAG: hypothetical protein M3Y20_04705 [Actinomycetota bacterium]|nr:hypothetical protein [Actinomycetota bacterium]
MTAPTQTPPSTSPDGAAPRQSRFSVRMRQWTVGGVVGVLISGFAAYQWLPGFFSSMQDAANRPPAAESAPAITDAELEAIKLTDAEIWTGENGSYWVLHVDAGALERELLGTSVEVKALDVSDAVIGEGATWTMLRKGETSVLAGVLEPTADGVDLDAQTVGVRTSMHLLESLRADPGLELVSAEIDAEASVVGRMAHVSLKAAEKTNAEVTIIVRDPDGTLLHVASRTFIGVDAVAQEAQIMLAHLDELPEGHTVEYAVTPM